LVDTRRRAGLGDDLLDPDGLLWAVARVFEQYGVAQQQVRCDEAGSLVQRKVPRHDSQQRADRCSAHYRPTLACNVELLVGD